MQLKKVSRFRVHLKEETYEANLLKYKKLYKEAFGANASLPPLPNFNQPPDPSKNDNLEEPQESAYEQKMNKELENEGLAEDNNPTEPKILQAIANSLQTWFWTIHWGTDIQAVLK